MATEGRAGGDKITFLSIEINRGDKSERREENTRTRVRNLPNLYRFIEVGPQPSLETMSSVRTGIASN